MKKEALEDCLGAVLGQCLVVLGVMFGNFTPEKKAMCRKKTIFEQMRLQEPLGPILGRSWADLGAPKGLQNGGRGETKSGLN